MPFAGEAACEREVELSRKKPGRARSIGRVSTRFGEGGGQLDRRRARGVLSPCARESKALTTGILRGRLVSDHGLLSLYESQQEAANGQDSWSVFQGCTDI